ncbi:MAG: hypothetical protein ACE15C_16800 [Phycisphaerae bacterium]
MQLWTAGQAASGGGILELLVDVRNRSVYTLTLASPGFVEVEIDGVWYVHSPAGTVLAAPFDKLSPGASCHA